MAETCSIVTCEHGGNRVPAAYKALFAGRRRMLEGHRGWDPGALELAERLAGRLQALFFFTTTTRLLVDCNRSLGRRGLFSDISRSLPRTERERIVASYYLPHRQRIEDAVGQAIEKGRHVIHLALHSFTPVLKGVVRRADIGLLYDSRRPAERDFCRHWQNELRRLAPGLNIRRNYPYLGKSDGLATWLRRRHAPPKYIGVEVEINQRLASDPASHSSLAVLLAETVTSMLART